MTCLPHVLNARRRALRAAAIAPTARVPMLAKQRQQQHVLRAAGRHCRRQRLNMVSLVVAMRLPDRP